MDREKRRTQAAAPRTLRVAVGGAAVERSRWNPISSWMILNGWSGGDAHYAALGRLLTFASRFETVAKTISLYVGLKKNRSVVDSDSALRDLTEKLRKMPLARHISDLGLDEDSVGTVLRAARRARNEIANGLTFGLDRCLDTLPKEYMEGFVEHLESLAISLAEGDRIVSYLAAVSTNEQLLSPKFLNEYPTKVAAWICEI